MKSPNFIRKQAQAGFTLIELIVVIVILGILAATALPRMFDMSAQARIAKMKAAEGVLRASMSTGHASWLAAGGLMACDTCGLQVGATTAGGPQVASQIFAEGTEVITIGGYPDVGGDGYKPNTGVTTGGMGVAVNLASDYVLSSTLDTLTITPDAAHPDCKITYKEASQSAPATHSTPPTVTLPVITTSGLTSANCD